MIRVKSDATLSSKKVKIAKVSDGAEGIKILQITSKQIKQIQDAKWANKSNNNIAITEYDVWI